MDYLQESLKPFCALSLHWSSDCNMACKYCFIEKDKPCMAALNKEIIQSLEDGSYVQHIKDLYCTPELINNVGNLSLWGAEPTINGLYFEKTITALLDYFPNVHDFMFSTNALVGGEFIFTYFWTPLYKYCEEHKRKLKWELQLSLDGPHEFNDDSRHPGATQNTLDTISYIISHTPQESEYLSLCLTTKDTLDVSYMRIMNERGIECFNWYYKFFNDVQQKALDELNGRKFITLTLNATPTMVDPGMYTIDDGKELAKWINNLNYVDRTVLPCYKGEPLFSQIFGAVFTIMNPHNKWNVVQAGERVLSCSAGKSNVTIDHKGNLFTCNRLCRNMAMSEAEKTKHAMRANSNLNTSPKTWIKKLWGSTSFHNDMKARWRIFEGEIFTMAAAGQIDQKYLTDEQARLLLFYVCCSICCHVGNEEDFTQNLFLTPTSIIKAFGNGAIDAMVKYLTLGEKRGDFKLWKTVSLI